ncbi:2,3-diaminopropionate biosynthesis protein SbnB [Streptomyces rubellomurinus]|uniref:Ornithine cyclodeaminase n=1 Tax=Streptomyces rubellomurinus (strain ATCC 31215) TaxID=359131 RepID=A0A0F2TIX0_STRR3|nr:2,3-diaminopropionate biosynthesis protein SbnB [Streptomyces rubellomurinus]KJS62230.1 ornithine cyclodeaminase [Streptomyces rubellomurinus]
MPSFHIIDGHAVESVISSSRSRVVDWVKEAYLLHADGASVNPDSYFLNFPKKPGTRIIALPAFLGGDYEAAGIKWVSSFPSNIERNMPRASATLILNDYETGYPFAFLEASRISAARTAASAVLGAEELTGSRSAGTITVIGAGVIARTVVEFFESREWSVDQFLIHDQKAHYMRSLAHYINSSTPYRADTRISVESAISGSDVVVLTTTATTPYITQPGAFSSGQVILNISLRDIGPEIVAASHNILDDVDHCLKANTSPHLTEQLLGHRDFIDGSLSELMTRKVQVSEDKPKIFSPFGLGVLDLAVGLNVYQAALDRALATEIPNFFGDLTRWP